MTYVLLGLLAAALAANITQAIWLRRTSNDLEAAGDLELSWRLQFEEKHHELVLAELNAKALTAELALTKELLATAQEQRNQAMGEARDNFVHKLQGAGLTEAATLVAGLLATPVSERLPVPKARRSDEDPSRDGLLDPEL